MVGNNAEAFVVPSSTQDLCPEMQAEAKVNISSLSNNWPITNQLNEDKGLGQGRVEKGKKEIRFFWIKGKRIFALFKFNIRLLEISVKLVFFSDRKYHGHDRYFSHLSETSG